MDNINDINDNDVIQSNPKLLCSWCYRENCWHVRWGKKLDNFFDKIFRIR